VSHHWTLHHLKEFKNVAANKATTMGHINRKHLDEAIVFIPNNIIMDKVGKGISAILEKLEINNAQIQTLKQTRDTLLPKLMSGQLRVDEFKEGAA
jgi:type I restriction enzyme S subunit